MPLHLDTPLIESHPLSLASGRRIFLKLDVLQPSGSFKLRDGALVMRAAPGAAPAHTPPAK